MLQGVIQRSQKCQTVSAPNFLQGVTSTPQQCLDGSAPASFIWCQHMIAVMPSIARTKGRAAPWPQQCHMRLALPNQFNGVIVKTQKCRDIVASRERSWKDRRNVTKVPPFPTNHRGSVHARRNAFATSPHGRGQRTNAAMPKQKRLSHQLQGVTLFAQKCHRKPAPTEFGSFSSRRNATNNAPNNQRPLKLRNNANSRSPRNIKRKTNGQEIRKPNHRKDTVCMAQPPEHGQSRGQASLADQSYMPWSA